MTLPLASLRELEEQLRAGRAAVAAARRALDEGRPTVAAVELDRIDRRLGVGREVVHDLLEGEGYAVERAPARQRALLGPLLAAWIDDASRACMAAGLELGPVPDAGGAFELDALKVGRLLDHLVTAALFRGPGRLELRCRVEEDGPARAILIFEAVRSPAPRAVESSTAELLAQRLARVLGGRFERLIGADAAILRALVPARVLAPSPSAEAVRFAGAPVLVVEDDDDARAALALLLEDWELDVAACGTYEEALARFAPGRFRVALLDLDLNGRSGFELHHELARLDAALGAIFLSGTEQERLAAGANVRYLLKPVDLALLEASIRELLEVRVAVGA